MVTKSKIPKKKPTMKWLKEMIKDEKAGIAEYSATEGFSEQARQEKIHLKKLQRLLKRR